MLEQADIEAIKTLLTPIVERLDNLEIGQQELTKKMGSLEQELTNTVEIVEQELTKKIGSLGQEVTNKVGSVEQELTKKMGSLEQKLTKRMGSLEEESRQTRVLIESDVRRDIQIIAEQHGDIIERLDKINQIDDLKDRVRNLERVVTAHSADLRELKKAQ